MSLPSIISTTSTYPRSKNSVIGAFKYDTSKVPAQEQLAYTASSNLIGSAAATTKRGAAFVAQKDFVLGSVFIPVAEAPTPTDNFIVEICSDDGAGLPGTVLASVTVAGSTLNATAVSMMEFDFTSSGIALVQGTRYHLTARRSGANNIGVNYKWGYATVKPNDDDYSTVFSSTTGLWTVAANMFLAYQLDEASLTRTSLTTFLSNETDNKLEAWCSFDLGLTWAIRDPTHSQPLSIDAHRSFEASQETSDSVHIGRDSIGTTALSDYFDIKAAIWRRVSQAAFATTISPNVSGVAPFFADIRAGETVPVFTINGALETSRRRIKLQQGNPPGPGLVDVITGTASLPGTAVDYDLRFMTEGANGDILIFWTQSDSTNIKFRRYKSDHTFGPIVSLTNTTIDQTSFYPIGNGLIYTDSVAKFALVYYDTGTSTVRVLRCTADSSLDTAGNWSVTTAINMVAETNLSIPAVISSDGGKKLFLWAVDDVTRKLKYTNDAGTDTWATETDWKPSQTYSVAAISMRVLSDRISLVYLDDSGTPRVKYDHLLVF